MRRAQLAAAAGGRRSARRRLGGGGSAAAAAAARAAAPGPAAAARAPGPRGGESAAGTTQPATPAERKALQAAGRAGAKPVELAGQIVKPGDAGIDGSHNDLPASVLALVGVLAAAALGGLRLGIVVACPRTPRRLSRAALGRRWALPRGHGAGR